MALEYASRKLDRLIARDVITPDQGQAVLYLLQDEHYMIDLFRRYGNLPAPALQEKIGDILEVTQYRIDSILSEKQRASWNEWVPMEIHRVRDIR